MLHVFDDPGASRGRGGRQIRHCRHQWPLPPKHCPGSGYTARGPPHVLRPQGGGKINVKLQLQSWHDWRGVIPSSSAFYSMLTCVDALRQIIITAAQHKYGKNSWVCLDVPPHSSSLQLAEVSYDHKVDWRSAFESNWLIRQSLQRQVCFSFLKESDIIMLSNIYKSSF